MNKRIVYRLTLTLLSPLSVGGFASERTDRDVIRDSRGIPFIPATSLCGVFRSYFDEDTGNLYFGFIDGRKSGEDRIRVYDATMDEDSYTVSERDNVRLEKKVPVEGGKFDCEIVETGAEFISYLELMPDKETPNLESDMEQMLSSVQSGGLRFGAKTTRGFGEVKVECKKRTFTDTEEWLDFDMFDGESWENEATQALPSPMENGIVITLKLQQKGGLSIREYATDVGSYDFKQLTLKGNNQPVLPGTSWAGAFRARYQEFVGKETTDALFGYTDKRGDETVTQKSGIVFSESVLDGTVSKILTRNAIDRFTGGTKDGALYTEQVCYNGTTALVIRVDEASVNANTLAPLFAVIMDLHNGFLAVGGLTSIGRGLFEVTNATVGNTDITEAIKNGDIDKCLSAGGVK